MPYTWDSIPAYRLQRDTVNDFLIELFGYLDFYTQLNTDYFQFWIPRPLTANVRVFWNCDFERSADFLVMKGILGYPELSLAVPWHHTPTRLREGGATSTGYADWVPQTPCHLFSQSLPYSSHLYRLSSDGSTDRCAGVRTFYSAGLTSFGHKHTNTLRQRSCSIYHCSIGASAEPISWWRQNTMPDKDLFLESCKAWSQFPENVVRHNVYGHVLKAYQSMLREKAAVLFCTDGSALVDIWEHSDAQAESHAITVSSSDQLIAEFQGRDFDKKDPQYRFLFIHSRHSRDRLRISHEMFLYAMTYHQVMPEFLEFIFPFGLQEYQEDFHFGAFRSETRLLPTERGLHITLLERSGLDYRTCYALKSVEKTNEEGWPWSIRQTAAYHSFEVDTGKVFWVIIKGNELMRDRIQSDAGPQKLKNTKTSIIWQAFDKTFKTHLVVCSWAVENWRWYLNFLEKRLEELTRHSLAIRVSKARSMSATTDEDKLSPLILKRQNSTWKGVLRVGRPTLQQDPSPSPESKTSSPPPPPPPPLQPFWSQRQQEMPVPSGEPDFSFYDLQQVQIMEDKLNVTTQVLMNNIRILQELKEFYGSLGDLPDFPTEIKMTCQRALFKFLRKIANIITDLEMHKCRAETLSRLLADRKTLLYGILDYRAMEANRLLAKRAQESTERMEQMTREMNYVALKTKEETVSMKIITLVTLFYLPGTFISTVMSTDIITFPSENGGLQWPALRVWLESTIPLMFITFVAWGLVHRGVERGWFHRKQKVRKDDEKPVYPV